MTDEKKKRVWLTAEQREIIVKRYIAGESPDAIADSMGICANNVRGALRKQGTPMRDRSEARTRLKHWQGAFDVLTDTAKYWVGFLFADGSLYNTGVGNTILDVGLAVRDREHLIKLRAYMRSEHTITESNNANIGLGRKVEGIKSRLSVRSSGIATALTRHGMKEKSLNRVATPELAASRHFWRGLVDGDGWIFVSNGKARLGVCGGEDLIRQFMKFVRGNGIITDTTIHSQDPIFRVDFSSGTAVAIIKLLYSNTFSDTTLDRKSFIAQRITSGNMEDIGEESI